MKWTWKLEEQQGRISVKAYLLDEKDAAFLVRALETALRSVLGAWPPAVVVPPPPEFAPDEVNQEEGGGDLIPVVLRGMTPATPNPLPASYLKAKSIEEACMKGSDEP